MRLIQALPFIGLATATVVKDSVSRAGLTPVRRQVDIVKGVFEKVQSDTQALDSAIKSFSGDGAPLISASNTLLSDLKSGTATIQASGDVDITGATQIAQFVTGLQSSVQQTITDLIAIKDKIVAIGQGGVTYDSLVQQKAASQALADATVKKTPAALQSVAQQLSGGIISALDQGVTAFADQQGKSAPASSAPASSPAAAPASSAAAAPASSAAAATSAPAASAPSSSAPTTAAAAPTDNCAAPHKTSALVTKPVASTTKAAPPATFTGAAASAVPVMGFAMVAAGLVAAL